MVVGQVLLEHPGSGVGERHDRAARSAQRVGALLVDSFRGGDARRPRSPHCAGVAAAWSPSPPLAPAPARTSTCGRARPDPVPVCDGAGGRDAYICQCPGGTGMSGSPDSSRGASASRTAWAVWARIIDGACRSARRRQLVGDSPAGLAARAFGDDDRGGDLPVVRERQMQVQDPLLLGGAQGGAAQAQVGAAHLGPFDGDVLPGEVPGGAEGLADGLLRGDPGGAGGGREACARSGSGAGPGGPGSAPASRSGDRSRPRRCRHPPRCRRPGARTPGPRSCRRGRASARRSGKCSPRQYHTPTWAAWRGRVTPP